MDLPRTLIFTVASATTEDSGPRRSMITRYPSNSNAGECFFSQRASSSFSEASAASNS